MILETRTAPLAAPHDIISLGIYGAPSLPSALLGGGFQIFGATEGGESSFIAILR